MTRPILFVAALPLVLGCKGGPPSPSTPEPSPAPTALASSAPSASAPDASAPAASAPLSDAGAFVTPPVCATPCSDGTSCRLTSRGPACVACDPAALPACKDDLTVAACKIDGTVETTDCASQKKRCVNGECRPRLCEPNQKHCHEDGSLYKCNATGTGRVLVQDCGATTIDGGPVAVCQAGVSPPACRNRCKPGQGVDIIAQWGCTCEWDNVPFCANESDKEKSGCEFRFCGIQGVAPDLIGYASGQGPCFRDTDGLAVPGSEKRGACAGDGEFGVVKVDYEVCRGGKAVAASRSVPCRR